VVKLVYCLDCKKLLNQNAYFKKNKRCRSCSQKYRLRNIEKHPMYGKKHTLKTRKKIGLFHKGKKLSLKHREKLSLSKLGKKNPNYGKRYSLEYRKKLSLAKKGKNHPGYGKKRSLKTRKKMSISQKERLKNPKNNPAYKDGRTLRKYYCVCCGKKLKSYTAKRCTFCYLLNKNRRQRLFDTDIELIVKKELLKRKIKFKHPYRIKNHPADFYITKYNLIIECDGAYWHNKPGAKEKDNQQSSMMRNAGYYVKRLKGENILKKRINYNELLEKYKLLNGEYD
jgi:very-short-patch-repair endonuclease